MIKSRQKPSRMATVKNSYGDEFILAAYTGNNVLIYFSNKNGKCSGEQWLSAEECQELVAVLKEAGYGSSRSAASSSSKRR